MSAPRVSVVIPAYNAGEHYRACLGSLMAQTFRDFEVIWVDSASTDGSLANVRSEFPFVRVVTLDWNAGYRKGSNIGAKEAKGELLVICNQDVMFERDWMERLVATADAEPQAAIVAPLILQFGDPETVNEAGNTLHFSGLYGSRGLGDPRSRYTAREELATMSGCCFLVRRSVWEELSGFSADFDRFDTGWHASYEDVDLAWRVGMTGRKVVLEPHAVMHHKFERKPMDPARFCTYEWGRQLTTWRNYSGPTLLLLFPMLVAIELGSFAFALKRGRPWMRAKWRAWKWMLLHSLEVLRMRRAVQAHRSVGDGVVIARMSPVIGVKHQVSSGVLVGLFELVSRLYYRIVVSLSSRSGST